MRKFKFEYEELNRGYIEVYADNEDDALDKAHIGDGDITIYKSDEQIGMLIDEE